MIGATLLCLAFIWYAYKLLKAPDRPAATSLYKYSLLFLALFFVLVMVDSVIA
jgi:heme O synthase-like polyprenyltransferase